MALKLNAMAAGALMALAVCATPALAVDVNVYKLDSTAVGAFGAPNYGTVTLTRNGTSVNVSIMLRNELNFITTGNSGSKAAFLFNATGVVAGEIGSIMDASSQTFSVLTPGNKSPFGQFTLGILCDPGCANGGSTAGYADPLTFSVANAKLADFSILILGGSPAAYFAADASMAGSGATGTVVAATVMATVLEPETYALLLAGLGTMGFIAKRRNAAM